MHGYGQRGVKIVVSAPAAEIGGIVGAAGPQIPNFPTLFTASQHKPYMDNRHGKSNFQGEEGVVDVNTEEGC